MNSLAPRLITACFAIAAASGAAWPQSVRACAACMGDPNSDVAGAANGAIFLMLGCIGGVLGLLSAFGLYLYRRSLAPLPPHVELAENLGAPSEGGIS
jgi:hypothetical protein